RQQLMQRSRARSRNTGNDHGLPDINAVNARCLFDGPDGVRSGEQRVINFPPGDTAPPFAQMWIVIQRQQQCLEPRPVVVRSELVKAQLLRYELVQLLTGFSELLGSGEAVLNSRHALLFVAESPSAAALTRPYTSAQLCSALFWRHDGCIGRQVPA